jgi:hypothetical protein
MTLALALALLVQAGAPPAGAPVPPAPATTAPSEQELQKAFGQSIAADQAAAAEQQGTSAPPAAAPTSGGPTRAGNLLNPEISVIGTFAASYARDNVPPPFLAGDDPAQQGFAAQELEVGFASDVDPYFLMRAFLTIPNLQGLEVEEAFLQTTSLPWNLMLKAGVFRSAVGRNNEQHLHVQDFARRPKVTRLLGEDGLRPPGAQLSVLLPVPWYATLYGEVFTLTPIGQFGHQLSAAAVLEQFFALTETWSLLVGANAASLDRGPPEGDATMADPRREFLAGGDVYLKWQPVNERSTYLWFALIGEYFARRTNGSSAWDGAGYGQLVAQVARRWRLGLRLDATGLQRGPQYPATQYVPSASIAFLPSEFSRIRLSAGAEYEPLTPSRRNPMVTLQYEAAIGAHGAHPF